MRLPRIRHQTLICTVLLIVGASSAPVADGASSTPSPGRPQVSTGGVSHVRATTGSLTGTIDPRTATTTYYFQYGPSTAYGSQTPPATVAAGTVKVKVAKVVTGLLSGYHYRLVATNSYGTTNGKDRVYTSKPTRLKLTLTKPTGQTVVGGPLVISGTLVGTGSANHKLVLQSTAYPYHEAFEDTGVAVSTDALGRFSLRVAKLAMSTEFRVATVDSRPVYSRPLTVPAAVRVTLHVRSSHVRGLVRLYGTVGPAQVGAKVAFQLQEPAKVGKKPRSVKAEEKAEESEQSEVRYVTKFRAPVKRVSSRVSHFSMIVSVKQGGRYRALVEVRKGPLGAGYSPSLLLHAAPGSAKK